MHDDLPTGMNLKYPTNISNTTHLIFENGHYYWRKHVYLRCELERIKIEHSNLFLAIIIIDKYIFDL